MKFSLLGLCAIAIMMTFGFMMAAPVVQTVDAHGDSHSYTLTVDALELRVCSSCGTATAYRVVGTATITITHADGESHLSSSDVVGVVVSVVASGTSSSCSSSSS